MLSVAGKREFDDQDLGEPVVVAFGAYQALNARGSYTVQLTRKNEPQGSTPWGFFVDFSNRYIQCFQL
jgi:hypothetical protein